MSLSKKIIYADNHASTLMDPRVADTIDAYNRHSFANPSSLDHEYGRMEATLLDDMRCSVAGMINASGRENIIFTSGATEANNLVFFSLTNRENRFGNIISTPFEHQSVIKCIDTGFYSVLHIPLNPDLTVNISELVKLIKSTNKEIDLISCMYANNEIGTIFQIKEIGTIAKKFHIPFHCDATQVPAWQKIDVAALNVDYLTLSGHKMYGPKGIGILYVSDSGIIDPMFHGGNQEFSKRAGTPNMSGVVGFTKALALCEMEREVDCERIGFIRAKIEKIFRRNFRDVDFTINGSKNRLPNNISITFSNLKPGLLELVNEKIAISDGSACQVGVGAISHVLLVLGYKQDSQTLRIGLGRFTTEEDGDIIAETIVTTVQQLS